MEYGVYRQFLYTTMFWARNTELKKINHFYGVFIIAAYIRKAQGQTKNLINLIVLLFYVISQGVLLLSLC